MAYSLESWYNDVSKSLKYLIDRNSDLDKSKLDRDLLENMDSQFHRYNRYAFIVGIGGIFYNIDAFLSVSDAKYILENIENINYVYNYDRGVDNIIGDVRAFVREHKTNDYYYIKFVLNQRCMFTEEHVREYFENIEKGLFNYEVADK